MRILDATWIVKSVFEHDRVRLAAEICLHLSSTSARALSFTQCVARDRIDRRLQPVDQISDPTRYHGVPYQLAEDCLEAALLARALERYTGP